MVDSDFDSVLELTKTFDVAFSAINDDGGNGRDSFLSWESLASTTPGEFLPSPLDATIYRLRLREFNVGSTGRWSVDMVTPLDSFVLTAIGGNGDSQLDSLKFGTDGPSAPPSLFQYSNGSTLVVRQELGVGSSGNGTLTQTAGTITAAGSLDVGSGGIVNLNGGAFNYNSGTLDFDTLNGDLTQNGGTLTPNTFDRAMVINGDYELVAGGIAFALREGSDISISADSIDLGTQRALQVSADVFANSQYNLGDTFTILQSDAAIVGTFATQDIVTFNDRTFDVIYNPLSVVLEVVAALSLAGDYNGNGTVDAADYTIWQDNFGATLGGSVSSLTIPEPGTFALVMPGLLWALKRRSHAV